MNDRNTGIAVSIALIIFAFSNSQCIDECSPVGKVWCEGNNWKRCLGSAPGEIGNDIFTIDCGEYGAKCTEIDPDNNLAGCLIRDEACPEGKQALCFDNIVATCVFSGYPEVGYEWGEEVCGRSGQYCVEVEKTGNASCSYIPEVCDPDGIERCDDKNPGIYYSCGDNAWRFKDECPDDTSCFNVDGGMIECR